jgi:hypothetical protein
VAGRAEQPRVARAFVGGVLGPGHPCGDDAVLLVSEMFGNSVRHSRSGAAGGTVTVAVSAGDGLVRVEERLLARMRNSCSRPGRCPAGSAAPPRTPSSKPART